MIHNEDTRSLDGVTDFKAVITESESTIELTHAKGTIEILSYDDYNVCLKGFRVISQRMRKGVVRRSVTITITLHIAETLQALIDGSIGTSDNDDFSEQMAIVLKKLDKAVSKHYA